MPRNLEQGQLGFTTDTGELFIGAPQLCLFASTAARNDSNVRLLTELDAIAQPRQFASATLPTGNKIELTSFPKNFISAIVDYGLTDINSGPYLCSTLWISNTQINDNPFKSQFVTFSLSTTSTQVVLNALCTSTDTFTVTYSIRSLITS